jgi:hypothetical protein
MIGEKQTTSSGTYYFAFCGTCGNQSPEAETKAEVYKLAIAAGWTSENIFPGGELATVYTCPQCESVKP